MGMYECDMIERVGMSQAEACAAFEIEQFKASLTKVTDDNIKGAFELFDIHELTKLVIAGKLWFKTDFGIIEIEEVKNDIVDDREITYELLFNTEADDREKQIELTIYKKVYAMIEKIKKECEQ